MPNGARKEEKKERNREGFSIVLYERASPPNKMRSGFCRSILAKTLLRNFSDV